MFRMLSSSFEDDPFFSESILAHQENMPQMMRSLSEPFGRDLLSISDGRGRARNHRGHNDGEDSLTAMSSLVPFGSFGGMHTDVSPFQTVDQMVSNMRNYMQKLERNFGQLSLDPNGHSFCSSSVMTYSKIGDEPPKVFQASTQTRRAPGGTRLKYVGARQLLTVDTLILIPIIFLFNIDDAHAFDEEWQSEVLKYKPGRHNLENTRMRSVGHENPGCQELKRREKPQRSPAIERGRRSNVLGDKLHIRGSSVKSNKK
ncbi:PREDICTED: myeloid leukemia factor 1 [Rhinopithecus bieti]|uniref:myeloid leukemia factor 1 n=1 Tax=Rhinopithecus bieti TaxID=61621 RepID=UPI00083C1C85|nr:PREDICTED: myeloid leukemia factor 1 [Rhinopithecus bieti]